MQYTTEQRINRAPVYRPLLVQLYVSKMKQLIWMLPVFYICCLLYCDALVNVFNVFFIECVCVCLHTCMCVKGRVGKMWRKSFFSCITKTNVLWCSSNSLILCFNSMPLDRNTLPKKRLRYNTSAARSHSQLFFFYSFALIIIIHLHEHNHSESTMFTFSVGGCVAPSLDYQILWISYAAQLQIRSDVDTSSYSLYTPYQIMFGILFAHFEVWVVFQNPNKSLFSVISSSLSVFSLNQTTAAQQWGSDFVPVAQIIFLLFSLFMRQKIRSNMNAAADDRVCLSVCLFACLPLCVRPHPNLISCIVRNAAMTEQFFLSSLKWPKPPDIICSVSRRWGGVGGCRMDILNLAGTTGRETEIP